MTTLRTDSTHSGITIDYANGSGFVHGGSGPLTVYSDDEKAAIKALQNADNDTYYLFVVDNVTRLNEDGTPMKDILAGYMPIGYQCGFLFGSPAAKYVAHELGHGAFGLHHTFSSETESFSAPQYSTNNLMDYTEHGTTLNHKQWTWMHEKHGAGLFGFLADESEGEIMFDFTEDMLRKLLSDIRNCNKQNKRSYEVSGYATAIAHFSNSFKINNKLFKNINITRSSVALYKIIDQSVNVSNMIDPTEITKESVSKSGDIDGNFIKYTFHALKEDPDIPMAQQLSDFKLFEIIIEEDDEWIFDVYLYNKPPKIQITLTEEESDELYTLSSYTVDNNALSGYILERPYGTTDEERTENSGKRIPEGTYSVCYPYNECNSLTTRGNAINEFKVLTYGKNDKYGNTITRDNILIHTGNYVWNSEGCLLPGISYQTYSIEKDYYQEKLSIWYTKGTITKQVTRSTEALNQRLSPYVRKKKGDVDALGINNLKLQISITINR